jgi:hypothetical protein
MYGADVPLYDLRNSSPQGWQEDLPLRESGIPPEKKPVPRANRATGFSDGNQGQGRTSGLKSAKVPLGFAFRTQTWRM